MIAREFGLSLDDIRSLPASDYLALSGLAAEYRPAEFRTIMLLSQILCLMLNQGRKEKTPPIELYQVSPDIWPPPTESDKIKKQDAEMKTEAYKDLAANLRLSR